MLPLWSLGTGTFLGFVICSSGERQDGRVNGGERRRERGCEEGFAVKPGWLGGDVGEFLVVQAEELIRAYDEDGTEMRWRDW